MKTIAILMMIALLGLFSSFATAEPTPDQCQNFLWDPVTTDTTGADISANITGYQIYFGTQAGVYGAPVSVGDVLSVPIDTVLPTADGDYFSVLTALAACTDQDGNSAVCESAYSNEVKLTYVNGAFRLGGVPVAPAPFRVQCTVITP